MPEEQSTHHGDDEEFLKQFSRQIFDRAVDETGTVVGGDDLDTGRQTAFELCELGLHTVDNLAGVLALPHDDDTARDFALAVKFGDPAPHVGADLNGCDIAEHHRNAACRRADRHAAEIGQRRQIAGRTDNIFGLGHFDDRPAGLGIGAADCFGHLGLRNAVRDEFLRVEHDLILLDHTADAGDLCHTRHALQLITQEPVLQAA